MSQIDQAAGAAIVASLPRPTRRVGLVHATSVSLDELLQLPPGHRITGMQWDHNRQVCSFAIEGPTMPEVVHGDRIPEVRPMVSKVASLDPRIAITWPDCRPPLRSVR